MQVLLSEIEKELLFHAAETGEIRIHAREEIPKWISAGRHDFPESYEKAVFSLAGKGLAKKTSNELYDLTESGKKVARELKSGSQ